MQAVIIVIFIFLGLSTAEVIVCDSQDCSISPKSGDMVVCTNECQACTISCIQHGQCKIQNEQPLIVYSAAQNTIINCNNEESCLGAKFYLGPPKDIPYPFAPENFDGIITGNIMINCLNKASCKTNEIYAMGNFLNNIKINAYGADSFKDGLLQCDLTNKERKCDLICFDADNTKSCDSSKFKCLSDETNCHCNGRSCPIVIRTCENDPCFIRPKENEVVVCTNQYHSCTIDCGWKKDACKYNTGIKIFSGSNNTRIYCNNYDSCFGTDIHIGIPKLANVPYGFDVMDFSGEKHSAMIDCNYKTGCKESKIRFHGSFYKGAVIEAHYSDSFKSGELTCDLHSNQKCELECGDMGLHSCQDLSFYCESGQCVCNGETCPDIVSSAPTMKPTISPSIEPTIEPTQLGNDLVRRLLL